MNKEMFTYTGKVRLTKKTKGGHVYEIKTKNHGTTKLFRGLCYALCGYAFDEYKPKYITIVKSTDIGNPTIENTTKILSADSGVVGSVDTSQNPIAKFTGSIAAYQFSTVTASGDVYLCLLCGEEGTTSLANRILAYLPVDQSLTSLTAGTVLGVEWQMSFENAPVPNE